MIRLILRLKAYIRQHFNDSKELSLFEKRLKRGYYDRPMVNDITGFTKTVLERDTKAVEDFTKSQLFREIINID